MSLSFTNILETDIEAALEQRFPPMNRLFDQQTRVILYPAGRLSRAAAVELQKRGVTVIGFGDRNASLRGSSMDGLPVFSPQQIIEQFPGCSILVGTGLYDSEVCELFTNNGCKWVYPMPWLSHRLPDIFATREYKGALEAVANPQNHDVINHAFRLFADDESRRTFALKIEYFLTFEKQRLDEVRSRNTIYFDSEIIQLIDQEVFLDGGAFKGDTLEQFLKISKGIFREYHAFEPDSGNFALLQQKAFVDPSRIFPIRNGLANQSGALRFINTSAFDSQFADGDQPGGESFPVTSLDEYIIGRQPPTFLKLDIEGFEASALRGAANLIAKHLPVLAISAYHYPEDLWKIPNLIHELNPDYCLLIRHYTREIDDTVCYAIPRWRMKQ
ncbi:MAG: FkbM family methyltransferase [Spirochaetales bacterium]|jgi:FkbM family methyltransferase|nr:FkbM family methyltransferase [Spirochaetales bacterium]